MESAFLFLSNFILGKSISILFFENGTEKKKCSENVNSTKKSSEAPTIMQGYKSKAADRNSIENQYFHFSLIRAYPPHYINSSPIRG